MYNFTSRVRYSELNHRKGILDCSSIINYFQDCSTFQSEDLNRGLSYLQSHCRVWLLNSWQLNLIHPIRLGDYITIGTWAHDFKGSYGYRNFIIQDEQEVVLAAANSIWVYMDTDTGRPVRIPKDYAISSGYEMEPAYPMEPASRKVILPPDYIEHSAFTIKKYNIDSYNHVNNGQYISLAEEYLPDDFMVSTMRAEYRAQAVLGSKIVPLVSLDRNHCTIALSDEEHRPYCVIEFITMQ